MAQLVRVAAAPTICFPPKIFPKHPRMQMALNPNHATASLNNRTNTNRKLPVLLFDIMDTIVRDPFYHDVPAFFGMSFKELIECKHPTSWVEFENGLINEEDLARNFFKDGRPLDLEGWFAFSFLLLAFLPVVLRLMSIFIRDLRNYFILV